MGTRLESNNNKVALSNNSTLNSFLNDNNVLQVIIIKVIVFYERQTL